MMTTPKWTPYAEQRPTSAGVYEWRIPSLAVPGMVVTFAAHMRKRGAGFKDVLSPSFDHWDGYRVHVPAGTEWRECEPLEVEEYAYANLAIEGLTHAPCAYCGNAPTLKGVQRSASGGCVVGGDPHKLNSWWLNCCQWGSTPHLPDPRKVEQIRRSAITAAVAAETARCLAIVRSEPEYPDADKTEHAHIIALIREHPITAAQAIAADVKEAIARRIEFQGETK